MTAPMTSRQRMLAAIHHDRVDRVPVSPWGLGRLDPAGPVAAELITRTDPWLEVGLGCDPVGGAAFPLEQIRRGNLLHRVIHAPGRTLSSTWKTTAQTTACVEYPCKDLADIDALCAIPYVRPQPDVSHFEHYKTRIGEDGLVVMGLGSALCYPNDMLGTEYCSYLWAAAPEIILRLVASAAERIHAVVEEACRGGVDVFRIVGGEYATQLMGRRAWEQLVVPFDGPLIQMIHRHGALAHYHNHGNMQRFLEDVAALGIDSLDPIEQPPYGDMEMAEAMARIGGQVCLVGGLDDMEILETHPREQVLQMGTSLLDSVGNRGFMLGGTSSGIYGETAARHFIALAELAAGHR